MKIVFVGPTLHGGATAGGRYGTTDIVIRPPAQQGDIARAVLDGATMIGLIDGRYEDVAAPWHKEILYALECGVRVLGAASMGALRAAECAAYGMVPVGAVAARYLAGDLTDDAAVAQIHAPPEMGCIPLTDALVNLEATLDAAEADCIITAPEATAMRHVARGLFFKDRTLDRMIDDAGFGIDRAASLQRKLLSCWRDVKREDAELLLHMMDGDEQPAPISAPWEFKQTTTWKQFMNALVASRGDRLTGVM